MSFTTQSTDVDLTNLNWVSGTPVPINCSVSPTEGNHRSRSNTGNIVLATPLRANASTSTSRSVGNNPSVKQTSTPKTPVTPPNVSRQSSSTESQSLAHPLQDAPTKPKCSYTCLIGMALKASDKGCLPVNEIYRYLE